MNEMKEKIIDQTNKQKRLGIKTEDFERYKIVNYIPIRFNTTDWDAVLKRYDDLNLKKLESGEIYKSIDTKSDEGKKKLFHLFIVEKTLMNLKDPRKKRIYELFGNRFFNIEWYARFFFQKKVFWITLAVLFVSLLFFDLSFILFLAEMNNFKRWELSAVFLPVYFIMIIPFLCDFFKKGWQGKAGAPLKWLGILLMLIGSFVDIDSYAKSSGSGAVCTGAIFYYVGISVMDICPNYFGNDTKVRVQLNEGVTKRLIQTQNLHLIPKVFFQFLGDFFIALGLGAYGVCVLDISICLRMNTCIDKTAGLMSYFTLIYIFGRILKFIGNVIGTINLERIQQKDWKHSFDWYKLGFKCFNSLYLIIQACFIGFSAYKKHLKYSMAIAFIPTILFGFYCILVLLSLLYFFQK